MEKQQVRSKYFNTEKNNTDRIKPPNHRSIIANIAALADTSRNSHRSRLAGIQDVLAVPGLDFGAAALVGPVAQQQHSTRTDSPHRTLLDYVAAAAVRPPVLAVPVRPQVVQRQLRHQHPSPRRSAHMVYMVSPATHSHAGR
jgi:hypothetical protein